ncbi:MAG: AAA family ATPase [Rhodospirillaceae bacterium]|nr:AAA family ATPase [Rhodospirillaceae bacterium]MBT4774026.1 AAA family ATPase [Rhodospirillaceae bacterium]MBT5358589.1 AAA family ATPase [Rhodospirillaceae bacterium]MBT5768789.1 AAA family ATPase [Rhodospirillaceae bacterium]MBT6311512.1 AAA family ATPase [Rhodospirillaceae bacterium]
MVNRLDAWLDANGLGGYAEVFAENDIEFDLLPDLTDDDLKELGLTLGHRKRFAGAIVALGATDPTDIRDEAAEMRGDRRPVTVLFADISGFTRMSGELGAEATRDMLNGFFEIADLAITDLGGRIDKHIGDEVMAVFGAPRAHTNDPERAVRAALAIKAGAAGLDPPLKVHIGVASGTVVASGTGSDAHREYAVIGESVNLASRLRDVAQTDEIVVSGEVHRAVSEFADATQRETGQIKGIDAPVSAWAIDGLHDRQASQRALVGRHRELQQFDGLLAETQRSRQGQIFILRGEAGIGKTRLAEELASRARAADIPVHRAAVLDFGAGTGADAIRDLVASLLDLPAGEERADALNDQLQTGELPQSLAPYLLEVLALPQTSETRPIFAAETPEGRHHGIGEAIAVATEHAAKAPILLIVEDAHWADADVRERLATLATRIAELPVLLIVTTRIENDPFDAAWRAGVRGTSIVTSDLGPLDEADAAALTGALADLDDKVRADCIARADGNPLFLEHLARAAGESGTDTLPDSVQSIVLAQVDQLPANERELLQAASAFGQRFTVGGVAALLGRTVADVETIAARGLVRRDGEAWRFAHALVRDGIYESLLSTRAQDLHLAAAGWYATRDATLHAEHLSKARDPQAPAAFLSAARLQAAAYRYPAALELTKRGLTSDPDAGDGFELALLNADIHHDSGNVREAIEQYRALGEAHPAPETRARAALGEVACLRVTGEVDEGLARLETIDFDSLDQQALTRFHHYRGTLRFSSADITGCLADQEAALEYAQQAGDPEWQAMALGGIGDAHYAAGRMGSAYESFLACVELAADHGLGRIELSNRHMVGVCRRYMNENAAALEDVQAARAFAERVGNIRSLIITGIIEAEMLMEGGHPQEADTLLEADATHIAEIGNQRLDAYNSIQRARARWNLGDPDGAQECAEHALTLSRSFGMVFIGARVLGLLGQIGKTPTDRETALRDGEALLNTESPIAHNVFWFYRDAIEAALDAGDWNAADARADALDAYTDDEPLPWTDFFIARGRALAAHGRDPGDDAATRNLDAIHRVAKRDGFIHAATRLTEALAGEPVT